MKEEDRKSEIETGKSFSHLPFAPYDPTVDFYVPSNLGIGGGFLIPYEYTGWRDETMSWKETCYLHAGLNPTPTFRFKGPEALKFISDTCVNSFANFPVGGGKHGIMCNEEGLLMSDGVLLRTGEDDFVTYWMAPYAPYAFMKGRYNAIVENLTMKVFLFQLGGPRSLEILETATGEDLHDIKFGRHRMSSIDGMEVRILRLGMAGTLAYEVHGKIEDVIYVYNAILKAGELFGIRKLGWRSYQMNHTEDGFPQAYMHFPLAWAEDKGFMEFLARMQQGGKPRPAPKLKGSMGTDVRLRYRNPVELDWGRMIKFDHDFVGRKALEKEVANPRRKMVTLVWNHEDILDVHASQFETSEPYLNMDSPSHFPQEQGSHVMYADKVLKDGKTIGISSGRSYSYYYREMLSLCSIDVEYSELGTEVTLLWGNPGTRQKEIRAVVSRFPYLNENRNENVDVSKIPCCARKNI